MELELRSKTTQRKYGRNHRSRARKHNGGPPIADLEQFIHKSDRLTIHEIQKVSNQLGYIPKNIVEISSKDQIDNPLAVLLYPLNFNKEVGGRYSKGIKPFPTIMWLTCPVLKARISRLENKGWVTKIQERLHNNELSEQYLKQMEIAHKLYAEERWKIMNAEDISFVEDNGWATTLCNVGIAGIRDYQQVKCLHCHYAHYLTRPNHNNIIGEWVHELLTSGVDNETDTTVIVTEEDSYHESSGDDSTENLVTNI
eukprot:gene10499-21898_t